MMEDRQQFIGHIIMQILDLYSEGKVPLPQADAISARAAYLCEEYMMCAWILEWKVLLHRDGNMNGHGGGGGDGSVKSPN